MNKWKKFHAFLPLRQFLSPQVLIGGLEEVYRTQKEPNFIGHGAYHKTTT
jgi:hypothetical protein